MKLSQFTVIVPDFPSNRKHLVYNTFNQATAVIGERAMRWILDVGCGMLDEKRKLKLATPSDIEYRVSSNRDDGNRASQLVGQASLPVMSGKMPDPPEYDSLDSKKPVLERSEGYINTFTDLGFVVDDSVDEIETFKRWYNESRYDKSTMRATILTTYDCNFACEYCVEDGVKNPVKMDEEHCRTTVNWLIERLDKYQCDDIRLQFYGGEPLMNISPIDYIASEINRYCKTRGTTCRAPIFSFTITTNGSLLKPDLVERLTPLGLKSIKITLDGDREAHNLKRPFRSGKGSFDVIIENILRVANVRGDADRPHIRIGTNVDSANLESVPRLLDYLEQIGLKDKIDLIKFDPIVHVQGQKERTGDGVTVRLGEPPRRPVAPSPCPSSGKWALDDLIWLTWDAYKRGFKTETRIQSTICSMNLDGTAVVIDPLGRIYTCPAFVGREGFQTGDIYHQELFDKHREFMSMEVPNDCFKCAYMPICGGGCKHLAYTRYSDLGRTVCERDYLQKVTAELLKMHVLSQKD